MIEPTTRLIVLRRAEARQRPVPTLVHDAQPPQSWDSKIIMLGGAIRAWWDEGWDTPMHRAYVDYRAGVGTLLVEAGFLVYRPNEAFKGTWNERAQAVNDAAIETCDLFVNLSPRDVDTAGTDDERTYALDVGCPVADIPMPWPLTNPSLAVMLAVSKIEKEVQQ